jgi:hypothetical protein
MTADGWVMLSRKHLYHCSLGTTLMYPVNDCWSYVRWLCPASTGCCFSSGFLNLDICLLRADKPKSFVVYCSSCYKSVIETIYTKEAWRPTRRIVQSIKKLKNWRISIWSVTIRALLVIFKLFHARLSDSKRRKLNLKRWMRRNYSNRPMQTIVKSENNCWVIFRLWKWCLSLYLENDYFKLLKFN